MDVNALHEADRSIHRTLLILKVVIRVCRFIPVIVIATTAPSVYAAVIAFSSRNVPAGILFSLLACGGLWFLVQLYQSHTKYKKAREEYRKRKMIKGKAGPTERRVTRVREYEHEHERTDAV